MSSRSKRSAEKQARGTKKAARSLVSEVIDAHIKDHIEGIEDERQNLLRELQDPEARRAAINKEADDDCALARKMGVMDAVVRAELAEWNLTECDGFIDSVRKAVESPDPFDWTVGYSAPKRAIQTLKIWCPEPIDFHCADLLRDRIAHEITRTHDVRADVTIDDNDEDSGKTCLHVELTAFDHASLPR